MIPSIITDFILSVAGYAVVLYRVFNGYTLDSLLADVPHAEMLSTQHTCAVRIVKVEDVQRVEGSYTSLNA